MADEPADKNKEPITSYGIILFYIDSEDNIWYLVSQRRDTIEYADFLRGRYARSNLETYFKLMSTEERERLEEYTFDELWNDLWVNHDNKFYREVYPKAIARYETNRDHMNDLLSTTNSTVLEPGWGFPKGKKNLRENEIQCAIREFKEETKMTIDYRNIVNIPASVETFKGSNNKTYSTVYYIAQVDHLLPIRKMTLDGIRKETISEEISNLAWVTLGMSREKLPAFRQRLLTDTEKKIRNYLDQ